MFEKETGILLFPDREVQPLETGSYYGALYTSSRLLSHPPPPAKPCGYVLAFPYL